MTRFPLSSARLSAVLSLVQFRAEFGAVPNELMTSQLIGESLIGNKLLFEESHSFAVNLGYIDHVAPEVTLTKKGSEINQLSVSEGEVSALRRVLFHALASLRRDLLWLASVDRSVIKTANSDMYQVLKDLDLIPEFPDDEINQYWLRLRTLGSTRSDEGKKEIGDSAEVLTLDFERARLTKLGRVDLVEKVTWLSRDSDMHGYDVLSFQGEGTSPNDPIHIEVKMLSRDSKGRNFFFLTRNEFQQAIQLGDQYSFHLWLPSQVGTTTAPIFLNSEQINSMVPTEVSSSSEWTERRVWINGH